MAPDERTLVAGDVTLELAAERIDFVEQMLRGGARRLVIGPLERRDHMNAAEVMVAQELAQLGEVSAGTGGGYA